LFNGCVQRQRQFQSQFLDLFQMRRCEENLAPSPSHPGCVYGEMNMCLRPCQQAVTPEEYASESAPGDRVPFHPRLWDVVLVSATAILISFLATIYPARNAARLDPVEVLRYE
jgi:ABC-type lipoprotein release transport system permease subunit